MFYKFIWNGGNDRVKRQRLCNEYSMCGLRMIDPYIFSLAQKMIWVKQLLDDDYDSLWKHIELSVLDQFNNMRDILWKAHAPEKVLNMLHCTQLADSLRTWYIFRDKIVKKEFDNDFLYLGSSQCIWYNKNIRSRSKQFFYYEDWFRKGIVFLHDLLNPPHPGCNLFEELILDFDISLLGRRKYNFLLKNIPSPWLDGFNIQDFDIHKIIIDKLKQTTKVPKYAYHIMVEECVPENCNSYWKELCVVPETVNWEKIHVRNFKCTIDTLFRSFYFKIFHKAIAFNDFLFKIKRRDSPYCSFCNTVEETITHVFLQCDKVKPIWKDIIRLINQKENTSINVSDFGKMFGIIEDKFLTYIFLVVKYYIYICKFQGKTPDSNGLKACIKSNKDVEYLSSKKRGKLALHFRKWRLDF